MIHRSLVPAALVAGGLLLAGCDALGVGGSGNGSAGAGNPELAREIAAAATQLDAQAPMQVDDITTLTGVSSNGTEIVYDMAISQDVPTGQIDQLRQAAQSGNQTNLCADSRSGDLIRMGATMTHRYVDPSGDRFETRVSTCPPAAGS